MTVLPPKRTITRRGIINLMPVAVIVAKVGLKDKMAQEKINWEEYEGFTSFKGTLVSKLLITVPHTIVAIFTGNRYGKTRTVCGNYIPRMIMGELPIPRFNLFPDEDIRTIRLCSEVLPNDPDGGEVRNTVYPALMGSIPRSWSSPGGF